MATCLLLPASPSFALHPPLLTSGVSLSLPELCFSFRVRIGETNIIETTISRIERNDMDQCLLKFQEA